SLPFRVAHVAPRISSTLTTRPRFTVTLNGWLALKPEIVTVLVPVYVPLVAAAATPASASTHATVIPRILRTFGPSSCLVPPDRGRGAHAIPRRPRAR